MQNLCFYNLLLIYRVNYVVLVFFRYISYTGFFILNNTPLTAMATDNRSHNPYIHVVYVEKASKIITSTHEKAYILVIGSVFNKASSPPSSFIQKRG